MDNHEKMKGGKRRKGIFFFYLGFCCLPWKGCHERKGSRIFLLDLGGRKDGLKGRTNWDLEEEEEGAAANASHLPFFCFLFLFSCIFF